MAWYLIGFHMTINSWRKGQDEEGWHLPLVKRMDLDKPDEDWGAGIEDGTPSGPPSVMKAVPQFENDVDALLKLMEPGKPHLK
jgi:hypothetical protein